MRFSLKGLLYLTTLVAVTGAGLAYPVALVGSIFLFFALAAVLAAIVVAICRPGAPRAVALSFAVVAGFYLWIATPQQYLTSTLTIQTLSARNATTGFPLATTVVLGCCYEAMHGGIAVGNPNFRQGVIRISPGYRFTEVDLFAKNLDSFLEIGHSTLAMIFGWFAASGARRIVRTGRSDSNL